MCQGDAREVAPKRKFGKYFFIETTSQMRARIREDASKHVPNGQCDVRKKHDGMDKSQRAAMAVTCGRENQAKVKECRLMHANVRSECNHLPCRTRRVVRQTSRGRSQCCRSPGVCNRRGVVENGAS